VQIGVDTFNPRVERALAERAIGFFVTLREEVRDPETGKVLVPAQRQYFPPDPTSMIFFLKNRMRDKYKDVHTRSAMSEPAGPFRAGQNRRATSIWSERYDQARQVPVLQAGGVVGSLGLTENYRMIGLASGDRPLNDQLVTMSELVDVGVGRPQRCRRSSDR